MDDDDACAMARLRWTCAAGLRSKAEMSSSDDLLDLVGIDTHGSIGAALPVKNPNSGAWTHSGNVGFCWGATDSTTCLPDSSLNLTSPFSSACLITASLKSS